MDDDKEEWLTQLEALEGGIGTSGYKKLCPGAQLRDVGLVSGELGEVGREERIARKGPVHILVKVPGPCAWKLANAKCPLLAFDPKSPIIRIPKAYAEGSGLYVGGDGVVLYLRKEDWRPDLCGDIPSIVPSSLESSMPIASAPESNTMQEEQLFTMFSWTLEDYQEALKNDEFFEHVKKKLTAQSLVTMESRMELLEEKFFVAGGSARMMFDESTESAMGSLLSALATVEDLIQCSMALSKPGILSSFVAREIGLRTDPTKLQALAQWLAMNPTMDGCMFEMFFFSSLALSF
ncbi:hypothetical protein PF004_g12845 [Phytophthora fragariae]|uniref:Uncharacterized protein n=1 Tax=Phytophthora fragariae TaxID=53985 RepID=A0A6G0NTY8_9STRA|nr:hypothetical protein PF004_g12845 [Phytophthora fragariae]